MANDVGLIWKHLIKIDAPLDDEMAQKIADILGGARQVAVESVDLLVRVAWSHVMVDDWRWLLAMLEEAYRTGHNLDGVAEDEEMNVDALVPQWVEALAGLSTAHDHAGWTAADETTDDLIGPILTAPVAQIREFAGKLTTALREDQRIPFLIWSTFQQVVEPMILQGKDSEIITLKKDLATRVADLVERNLDRAEMVAAIAGSLQWRSETALVNVEKAVAAGSKPKIYGKESCLFISVQTTEGIETVVL